MSIGVSFPIAFGRGYIALEKLEFVDSTSERLIQAADVLSAFLGKCAIDLSKGRRLDAGRNKVFADFMWMIGMHYPCGISGSPDFYRRVFGPIGVEAKKLSAK